YSAKAILLEIPMSQEEMCDAVVETCRANQIENGYIRLIVTRGAGSLGLSPDSCPKPGVIIIANTIQLYPREIYENGMEIITAATSRNYVNAVNPAIKSLNYLNNILAKIEASNAGCEEAIMLNSEGFVAECTGDNIFILHKGTIYTPPLAAGALYGITRNTVIDLAREAGFKVEEKNLTRYDLFIAEECFLTGSGAEIVPVVMIDKRIIGSGKPGDVTRKLEEKYHALTHVSGEPI
ncbi:MAG TPA: branched-chain-amino-acid transaminase, partial [Verrucomicrobiales bacterium]|nr:branched-chain-amino-acid transaminase [Verrucomicrobiales bacterium]